MKKKNKSRTERKKREGCLQEDFVIFGISDAFSITTKKIGF